MWHCPVCNNSIDANFGMVQCSKCQSVLFIDFAGNIVVGEAEESPSPENLAEAELENKDIELESNQYSHVSSSTPDQESGPDFGEAAQEEVELFESEGVSSTNDSSPYPDHEVDSPVETIPINLDIPFGPISENVMVSQDDSRNKPLREELSLRVSGPNGIPTFQITIEGIDSSNLRKDLLDALANSRLGFVNNEISENIDQGRLVIRDLNAVKASFIMNSLKDLPVEIKWEMYEKDNPETNL